MPRCAQRLPVLALLGALSLSPAALAADGGIDLSAAIGLNGSAIGDGEHYAWDAGMRFAYADEPWNLRAELRHAWEKDGGEIERDNRIDAELAYSWGAWRLESGFEWRREALSSLTQRNYLQGVFSVDYAYNSKLALNVHHEINAYRVRGNGTHESAVGIRYQVVEGLNVSVHGEREAISAYGMDDTRFNVQLGMSYQGTFKESWDLDMQLTYTLSGDGEFDHREVEFEGTLGYRLSDRLSLECEVEAKEHHLDVIRDSVDYMLRLEFALL